MVNGLVVALLYLAFMSCLPELVFAGGLSLTAEVSLCFRWEREINNLSMEMWPSKYGQGLFIPLTQCLVLSCRNIKPRRHFVFCTTSFFPPYVSPYEHSFVPWKDFKVLLPACFPLNLHYIMWSVVDSNMRAVIHRWGFKFKMSTNLCTAGHFTASSQSFGRSR